MSRSLLPGWGLVALGLGMAASSLLGPLGLRVIQFRISPAMENQLLGGDAVSLALAAPVAVIAGLLWLRRHPLAPLLAPAPAIYAVYTYLTNILAPDYLRYPGNNERFYPLFLALIVLGWVVAAVAWTALRPITPPAWPDGLRWTVAGLLLVVAGFLGLAWWAQIAVVMGGGVPAPEYVEHPAAFWLIRTLDTAFLVPLSLAAGTGLLRRRPMATTAAYVLVGFCTCLGGSIAAMAAVMQARHDPSASPALLAGFLALTVALGAVMIVMLWTAAQAGPRSGDRRQRVDSAQPGRVGSPPA